jgi:hypothetical protein
MMIIMGQWIWIYLVKLDLMHGSIGQDSLAIRVEIGMFGSRCRGIENVDLMTYRESF